ncbi:MAG: peptidylprolyl isomerase [Nitratireductor sp.]|nr:peptidylprolyl isomerase [Nitratireductor sp.]
MALLLAGCTTPTEPLESSAKGQQVAAATALPAEGEAAAASEAEAAKSKVLKQRPTVAQKGTYIRALVNGEPITNYDIQRRQKFRQLRRVDASQEAAFNELIDERVKMTAAKFRNMAASDQQVEEAFANFAKSNKATPEVMTRQLDGIGIGAEHFKEYIRVQITWSRMAGGRLQQETREKSGTQAIVELRKSGQQKPRTTEYILQQIIFVIPKEKAGTTVKARTAEAQAFRAQYQGCDKAIQLAKSYKDVAVKELGRTLEPELPKNWLEPVKATQQGQLTQPQATEKGVEMLGICRAKETDDDKAVEVLTQAETFEQLENKGDDAAAGFLAELRQASTIVYR